MPITRLSGGNTPADGSDPRTFPAIWNPAADLIEANETDITALQALIGDYNLDDLNDVDITTPANGQFLVYDNGDFVNQTLTSAQLPTGTILQVVSTAKVDTFTTTSASFVDVTGLTASITPTSTSSKIMVFCQVTFSLVNGGTGYGHFRIAGGNTASYVGAASGSKVQAVFGGSNATGANNGNITLGAAMIFLDSPSTSSAVTYSVQARQAFAGTVFVNRSSVDDNDASVARGASSITVMEVAG